MIITNEDPPFDPSQPTSINWLDVKAWAQDQGEWYGSRITSLSTPQRLVNLWYLYAWLKYSGYEFYSGAAIASIMWFASGYSGGIWGTGICHSPVERPGWQPHIPRYDPETEPEPPPDYWFRYLHAHPSDYQTFQGSTHAGTTNWRTLDWVVPGLPEGCTLESCPSYGLSQWTPAITVILRMMQDADQYYSGIGIRNEPWSRWWPDNPTLQLFGMDWQNYQSDHTLPENQGGTSYHAEWVYNQIVNGYSERMTWTEYKQGQAAADYDEDLDKFHHSCYNWLTHYIQASRVEQLNQDKANRETVYLQYIKPAFTAWNRAGGASLSDLPAPPGSFFTLGTWNDPINSISSVAIWGRRKQKHVRTILL